METWVWLAVLAAGAQAARFALQKRIGARMGAWSATLARFLWGAPLAGLAALGVLLGRGELPGPTVPFALWAALGGACQIAATLLVVRLFGMRDFAVGIALKKTEVILTGLAGWVLIGDALSPLAGLALLVGLGGVLLLSDSRPGDWRPGPALWIGLLSGLAFAVSAVGYRAAALALDGGLWWERAILTLAAVTAGQALAMGLARPGALHEVAAGWRATAPVGIASALGSACWFGAFALQAAALVFAVGQVELAFSLLIGWLAFGERPGTRPLAGIALVGASAVAAALA